MQQISFGYPRRGLDGHFNTIRLGRSWVEKVKPGDVVELVDARSKRVLKLATVSGVLVGALREMAQVHGAWAHNWKLDTGLWLSGNANAKLLIASMCKRYPPNRCTEDSIVSVIYMKVIDEVPPETAP